MAAGRRDLSGLLFVLGGELHFDCKAGPGGGLQVLFRRCSFPYCLSVIFFVDSDDKYQTDGRGGWFWNQVMTLVYSIDAADNLFPSIHCLVSWFCYIGIRGKKEFPAWYRGCSLVMAVLICLSTVLTKQHVLVDVAGGVLLAELCFWAGKKPMVYGVYEKVLDRIHVGGNK